MRRPTRLAFLTTAALLFFSASTLAIFTNGGFESASLTGWTESTFLNFGLSE